MLIKISQLPDVTTPLNGSEVIPIVQSGVTKKIPLFSPYTTPIAGSKMKINYLSENSNYKLVDEAGIWAGLTETYFGISKEFTSSNGSVGAPCVSIFGFANNSGSAGDVVAILGDAVARLNNTTVFGGNLIARNGAGTTGTKLVGLEIDLQPSTGTTISNNSIGLAINIYSINTNAPAIQLGSLNGGKWANGITSLAVTGSHFSVSSANTTTSASFMNTQYGIYSNAAVVMGTGASQSINFGAQSFGVSPYLFGASDGTLIANMGASGFVVFQKPTGEQTFTFNKFGNLNMPNNGSIQINTVQVVAQRQTGWVAMTGTSNIATAYDTATVTLTQLASRVLSLQAALTTHGLIGT
jgi:hypothetical protein